MGLRGFAPKPTALRVLEGNPSRRKLNSKEAQPRRLVNVEPPEDFSDQEKKIWNSLAHEMVRIGLLTEIDIYVLYRYVRYISKFIEISKLMTNDRLLVTEKNPDGSISKIKPNPLIRIMNDCSTQCSRLEMSLGLSPSSRSRIIAGLLDLDKNDVEEEDPYGD